jgi:hypothetical protein
VTRFMKSLCWWTYCAFGWPRMACAVTGKPAEFQCMDCLSPVRGEFWCAGPQWIGGGYDNRTGAVGLCVWCHNRAFGFAPLRSYP